MNEQVIVVVVSNYPHDLMPLQEAKAILFTPSGCQELGRAIADVMSGSYNPSGRLNMTWYSSFEDLPAKMNVILFARARLINIIEVKTISVWIWIVLYLVCI